MDRDEEKGHGDRSLLFIGDEDDDLGVDRDGGSPPSSDAGSSFSDRSDDGVDDDPGGDGSGSGSDDDGADGTARDGRAPNVPRQQGAWPQSYRFVGPSIHTSSCMRARFLKSFHGHVTAG
jgi:vesicular inhibitory amino acid transporter